ncbi:hypothetical protein QVD17_05827 [Tagetes erecta]|uniref:Reverse transcriptase zinc-binding domain-containing protein n=1 Tax=Tagetes erecta TaxID=13708 RepID=A0AAD8LEJ7_TARER|nr:hypothetical protein QVD17_05827 [Tagetes erecta]
MRIVALVAHLIYGSPTAEFSMTRGLRQGDPISPFLFILVMEAFNIALNSAGKEGLVTGIRLPNNGPVVSQVLFADDALLMGEWSLSNCINLSLHNHHPSQRVDSWSWAGDASGEFSVHSLRNILEHNRVPVDFSPFSWLPWIPLKVRCLGWRVSLDKIASKHALIRRGVKINSSKCSLCFGSEETNSHILKECPFAKQIWSHVFNWIGYSVDLAMPFKEFMEAIDQMGVSKNLNFAIFSIFMAAFWLIWTARNEFIFSAKPLSVSRVVDKIKVHTYERWSNVVGMERQGSYLSICLALVNRQRGDLEILMTMKMMSLAPNRQKKLALVMCILH